MTVLLATQAGSHPADGWIALDGAAGADGPPLPDPGAALEAAFTASAPVWWELGRTLAAGRGAGLAHAPACVANASDLGQMLAWTQLIDQWAAERRRVLVLCRDPWLFRHFAARPGVEPVDRAPPLWPAALRLALRGLAARGRVAVRMALAAWRLRRQRRAAPTGGAHLLVYGHPASRPGHDAYFGDLMAELPELGRLLHVDCPPRRALALAADGRTRALHAWGAPWFALARLPWARWRPDLAPVAPGLRWLVRRAAALEGGTGQAAMILWQLHCQRRWLAAVRPRRLAWPWENHSWERALVRAARARGVATVGYQHSVIGRQMFNYAAHALADPAATLPDRVLCSGAATLEQLAGWGVARSRLAIGGALRFSAPLAVVRDAAAPVFVALPFDQAVAAEMVAAARAAAAQGWRFVVRDHPMTPFAFAESPGVTRAEGGLGAQAAVAAVVYAATTVGLEAILAGLPTLRFRPAGRVSLDILPDGIAVPVCDGTGLAAALAALAPPTAPPGREAVFAAIDPAPWRTLLAPD
ncbi:hypothetical protein [Phaeospirillum tilakii]|uniref:Uncharacterized protein n=1 Tax=Phaeospirillum tilakii TaxID=741673 RepID=A0ABW5CF57_9PROT